MKNSGVEWIGEIPYEWEVRKFKYFFDIYGGSGFKEEYQGQENGDFPFCKASDINGTEKNLISAKNYVNQDLVDKESYIIIPKNSILVSKIGEAFKKNHRKVNLVNCIVDNNCEGFVLNTKNDINYLYYVLKCIDMSWFDNGGTIPSVNNFKLKNFFLPNCLYETQQRIASYLDKKCSKIEETIQNQQQVIEKLKAYKQSLITEVVTGKIKIQNGKVCGKYESYKESRLKWLGDFKIPEKWNSIQVKSCVSIPVVDGPHESPELFDNGIPYISATAIENSKIDFSLKRGFISEKYCDECDKRYKPMRDDILMIKLGATTGQVAIIDTDERFNIWVPLAAIRCNKTIALPKFVFYSFQSDYCLKQMEMSWTFGTQQTLGVSSIERLKIFLPNVETQKEIADYLDKKCTAIDTAIEQKQKLIEKLTEYKKSLIYECVTGKKEI